MVSVGAGVGQTVFTYGISEALAPHGTWRQTFQIYAGVGSAIMCVSALVIRRIQTDEMKEKPNVGKYMKELVRTDRSYQLLMLATTITQFGMYVPFIFMVPYVLGLGLSPQQGNNLIGTMFATSIFGRLGLGTIGAKFGALHMTCFSALLASISSYAWIACTTYESLMGFASAYGIAYGAAIALFPLLCVSIPGSVSIAYIVPSLLQHGDYKQVFIFSGSMQLCSFFAYMCIEYVRTKKRVESKQQQQQVEQSEFL
jgi:nitrate/nitrite transporter NarK